MRPKTKGENEVKLRTESAISNNVQTPYKLKKKSLKKMFENKHIASYKADSGA
jgi:hypothetical protein